MGIKKDGILFIGLDSANLGEIIKWREELPNFNALMENGCYGQLQSTVPPFSPPAWTSMMTGKNPAKHNIFDWISFPKNPNDEIQINTSTDVKAATLWEVLSNKGMKSCVMNVPVITYPAKPINGVMVAGIPGHTSSTKITYPQKLVQKLEEITNGYEIVPSVNLEISNRGKSYMKEFSRVLLKRLKTAVYLLNKATWDLFIVVFFLLDSVQHYYWHHMDQNHPFHNPKRGTKYGRMIKEFYKKLDMATGRLLKEIDDPVNVIIASDHGMQSCYGEFQINNLLRQEKLLTLQKVPEQEEGTINKLSQHLATQMGLLTPRITKKIIEILPRNLIEKFSFRGGVKSSTEIILRNMDFDNSIAYGLGEYGQIFLNQGTGSEEKVRKVLDRAIKKQYGLNYEIYRKKDLFKGAYMGNAPDITCSIEANRIPIRSHVTPDKKLITPPNLPGEHARKGVFIACGPGINPENKKRIYPRIYDLLPTILSLLGISLPSNLDGKVLNIVTETDRQQEQQRFREKIQEKVSKVRDQLS